MRSSTKIVLVATFFNLLFEFSFRGIIGFWGIRHIPLFLFLTYFSWFSIIEYLIHRYRITNKQLLIAAFAYGLLPMTFLTGVVVGPGMPFHINWLAVFGVNIVWWGFLQGLLTFYLANRLVKRDWNERPLGSTGLTLAVLYLVFSMLTIFRVSPGIKHGPGIMYLAIIFLFFAIVVYLKRTLKERPVYAFERHWFLDLLCAGAIFAFLFSGLVLAARPKYDPVSNSIISHSANMFTQNVTRGIFFAMLGYYLVRRRPITI
jgi:hypothetical protein